MIISQAPYTLPAGFHKEGKRYITCTRCGVDWNIPKRQKLNKNRYLCPICAGKR